MAKDMDIQSAFDGEPDQDTSMLLGSKLPPKKSKKATTKPKPKNKLVKLSKLATPTRKGKSKAAVMDAGAPPNTKWPTFAVPGGGWLVFNEKGGSYAAHCHLHGASQCRINKVLTKQPIPYLLKWLEDGSKFNSGDCALLFCQDELRVIPK